MIHPRVLLAALSLISALFVPAFSDTAASQPTIHVSATLHRKPAAARVIYDDHGKKEFLHIPIDGHLELAATSSSATLTHAWHGIAPPGGELLEG